jgi:uncharacterized protein
VRRVVALGVLVAVVAMVVIGVGRLAGDGGDPAAIAGAPAKATTDADPAVTAGDAASSDDDRDAPEDDAPPSAENPARLLILGDSDAGTFGPYLMSLLDGNGVTDSELFYKVSSGLSRPDFFDWPAEITRRLPESDPDIVVVTFGGNDAQDLLIDGRAYPVTTKEWQSEYGRRVGEAIDLLTGDGRTLVWVGIPNAESAEFTERLEILRDVTVAEIQKRPDVIYIDTWDRFDGLSGGYADFVVDPRDGRGKNVRASDGFHLNVTGAEILALDIARAIEDDLRRRGADI